MISHFWLKPWLLETLIKHIIYQMAILFKQMHQTYVSLLSTKDQLATGITCSSQTNTPLSHERSGFCPLRSRQCNAPHWYLVLQCPNSGFEHKYLTSLIKLNTSQMEQRASANGRCSVSKFQIKSDSRLEHWDLSREAAGLGGVNENAPLPSA